MKDLRFNPANVLTGDPVPALAEYLASFFLSLLSIFAYSPTSLYII